MGVFTTPSASRLSLCRGGQFRGGCRHLPGQSIDASAAEAYIHRLSCRGLHTSSWTAITPTPAGQDEAVTKLLGALDCVAAVHTHPIVNAFDGRGRRSRNGLTSGTSSAACRFAPDSAMHHSALTAPRYACSRLLYRSHMQPCAKLCCFLL